MHDGPTIRDDFTDRQRDPSSRSPFLSLSLSERETKEEGINNENERRRENENLKKTKKKKKKEKKETKETRGEEKRGRSYARAFYVCDADYIRTNERAAVVPSCGLTAATLADCF